MKRSSRTTRGVVKMIGDEVMYVATDPVAAAEIALDLRDAISGHAVLSGLRGEWSSVTWSRRTATTTAAR